MQFCHTHDFAQKTCSPHLRLQSLTSNLDVPGDGSCFVSFDELRHVARITLAIPPSELAEARLRALWCLLDGDDSNAILMEEIAPFLNGQIDVFDRLLQSESKGAIAQGWAALPDLPGGAKARSEQAHAARERDADGKRARAADGTGAHRASAGPGCRRGTGEIQAPG